MDVTRPPSAPQPPGNALRDSPEGPPVVPRRAIHWPHGNLWVCLSFFIIITLVGPLLLGKYHSSSCSQLGKVQIYRRRQSNLAKEGLAGPAEGKCDLARAMRLCRTDEVRGFRISLRYLCAEHLMGKPEVAMALCAWSLDVLPFWVYTLLICGTESQKGRTSRVQGA